MQQRDEGAGVSLLRFEGVGIAQQDDVLHLIQPQAFQHAPVGGIAGAEDDFLVVHLLVEPIQVAEILTVGDHMHNGAGGHIGVQLGEDGAPAPVPAQDQVVFGGLGAVGSLQNAARVRLGAAVQGDFVVILGDNDELILSAEDRLHGRVQAGQLAGAL